MQSYQGHLSGGVEKEVILLAMIDLFLELWQLACTLQYRAFNQEGGQYFGIAMFVGMCIEHEGDQRAFQTCTHAFECDKATARDTCATGHIDHAQAFSQYPVRLGFKVEGRWLAPVA